MSWDTCLTCYELVKYAHWFYHFYFFNLNTKMCHHQFFNFPMKLFYSQSVFDCTPFRYKTFFKCFLWEVNKMSCYPLWLLPTWYTSTQSENEASIVQRFSKHWNASRFDVWYFRLSCLTSFIGLRFSTMFVRNSYAWISEIGTISIFLKIRWNKHFIWLKTASFGNKWFWVP